MYTDCDVIELQLPEFVRLLLEYAVIIFGKKYGEII